MIFRSINQYNKPIISIIVHIYSIISHIFLWFSSIFRWIFKNLPPARLGRQDLRRPCLHLAGETKVSLTIVYNIYIYSIYIYILSVNGISLVLSSIRMSMFLFEYGYSCFCVVFSCSYIAYGAKYRPDSEVWLGYFFSGGWLGTFWSTWIYRDKLTIEQIGNCTIEHRLTNRQTRI